MEHGNKVGNEKQFTEIILRNVLVITLLVWCFDIFKDNICYVYVSKYKYHKPTYVFHCVGMTC